MNGDQQQFLAEVDKRLAILEDRDIRRSEAIQHKYSELKLDIGKLFGKFDEKPCIVNTQKIKGIEENQSRLWNWFYGTIIFVIVGGIIGAVVKAVMAG